MSTNVQVVAAAAIRRALGVVVDFDANEQIRKRIDFIKQQLIDSKQFSLVLGVSGGVDSLTAAMLCQRAVDELNMAVGEGARRYSFIAVKLPYHVQKDRDIVEECLAVIKPTAITSINIAGATDALMCQSVDTMMAAEQAVSDATILNPEGLSKPAFRDFVKGNIKARMRMVAQYALANMHQGLVVGTDHAAEAVTGFFTKFGDGGCDIAPLSGLVKREVRELARVMGAPAHLYEKVPTADLEELAECKPDEVALGVSYSDIDAFLKNEPVSDEAMTTIIGWYARTEHKRQLPIVPSA